jgi:hypothetical protein
MGAVAHVFLERQHPAVLVVMPRPGRPVTEAMRSTVRAVAQALETDVMQSSHTSHGD